MFKHQKLVLAARSGHLSAGIAYQQRTWPSDGEHAVDAHHCRVAVVGGQRGADLVVGDHRQVD